MDTHVLPNAIEPDYWNVVFHPSESALARLVLGRFQHVSAFTYVPGFRGWILYDVQWSGVRLTVLPHISTLIDFSRGCTVLKFYRRFEHMPLLSRFGFYCVPAIKHLLGLSCVAATPDGLYRALLNNGGIIINESIKPTTAAAGSDAAGRTAAGAG